MHLILEISWINYETNNMKQKPKIKISEYPKDGKADYDHLSPIVNFLLAGGNKSINEYIWGNNRTGYFCHLEKDIDFKGISEKFDLPDSIKIDKKNQVIDCFNTYSVIKKSHL